MKKCLILSMSFLVLFSGMAMKAAWAEEEKECIQVSEQTIRVKPGKVLQHGNLRIIGTIEDIRGFPLLLTLRANVNQLRWEEISQPHMNPEGITSNKVHHAENTDTGTPFLMYRGLKGMQATIVSCGRNIVISFLDYRGHIILSFAQF